MNTNRTAFIVMLALAFSTRICSARNVDLSTVPHRDTVQLTIYNSEDLTLVREMRTLTFKKGINGLQFSWANTLIDPSSVELKFLTSPDKLVLLDTTFPHDKPQMLSWNVLSEFDGDAKVEITYFTSGITWSADYVLTSDVDEKNLSFEGFVRVTNNSGEEYEDAQVRLVVGTINLVEKIAQLAQIPMDRVEGLDKDVKHELRRSVAKAAMMPMAASADMMMEGGAMPEEKQIVKEGLSEYFIFSIPGTESIPNGWSKRLRAIEASQVPFKVQYRYRPVQYGDQLVRMYIFTNNEESKLGGSPLPDGIIRVFRQNGRNGLSFLAQEETKYIPIGDKVEVNLGVDPEVIFELIKLRAFRDNIWMHVNGVDVFKRVDDGAATIEVDSSVIGWDDHEIYTQRIRNYTAKSIDVEVRRSFHGHVEFRSSLPGIKMYDFATPEFLTTVPAGKKVDCLFEILRHQGRNAKQNNVVLGLAEIVL